MTEKNLRKLGYNNTISEGANVNALKNIIINSNRIDENKRLAYFCGDNISSDLDIELKSEGFKIDKIINLSLIHI